MEGLCNISKFESPIVPIQIEKKCFFLRVEQRFSFMNRFCYTMSRKCGNRRAPDEEHQYDHFSLVSDKFPLKVQYQLDSTLLERQIRKINSKLS